MYRNINVPKLSDKTAKEFSDPRLATIEKEIFERAELGVEVEQEKTTLQEFGGNHGERWYEEVYHLTFVVIVTDAMRSKANFIELNKVRVEFRYYQKLKATYAKFTPLVIEKPEKFLAGKDLIKQAAKIVQDYADPSVIEDGFMKRDDQCKTRTFIGKVETYEKKSDDSIYFTLTGKKGKEPYRFRASGEHVSRLLTRVDKSLCVASRVNELGTHQEVTYVTVEVL